MMIIIADSGSTKTSWCLFETVSKRKKYLTTSGINPFFRTTENIINELKEKLIPVVNERVEEIYFYGAGVVDEQKGNIVKSAFRSLFGEAFVKVQSDLLAAARATLADEKGISCILGTGSNSCLFNGKEIIEHVPPLGFILGDEGSGAVLGKKLLADYLKGIMSKELAKKFEACFSLEYSEFLNKVYRQENPNTFLAELVPFLKDNIEENYCKNLIEEAFSEFVQRNIFRYSDYQSHKICFTGSVAFYFQQQLIQVLKKYDLIPGIIVKEPMEGLIQFHLKELSDG